MLFEGKYVPTQDKKTSVKVSSEEFDKIWPNNWKNIKLWVNNYQNMNNLQSKISAFYVVLFLLYLGHRCLLLYPFLIFLCSFTDFNKNGKNNWKNTKLCENYYRYLNKLQQKFQYLRLFCFWVTGLKVRSTLKWFLKVVPV